jgi:hypothetical protein
MRRACDTVVRPIHRNCGKHCGQPPGGTAQRANLLAPDQIAEILSIEKALPVRDLNEYVRRVTGLVGARLYPAHAVEFSQRSMHFHGDC